MVGNIGIMKSAVQVGLNWWNTWREQSINRRIFAAMLTVGGVTVVVKLAAAAKEIVVASQFGTSDELDAFLIAFLLPQFAINLIGGSLNAALIPTYLQVREQQGKEAAQRLLSGVMVLSVGFLVGLSVVLAVTASYILPLVASGFSPEKLALARSLYYGLLATLVLSGLATTWGAILNAENRFALPAAAPVATSILTVLVVIGIAKQWGGHALVLGVVGGVLIETVMLGWALAQEGVSLIPRWSGISPAVKEVLRQYAPMVAAGFLMGGAAVVSQSMAAMLDSGSVSALAYGNKVTSLIIGIGAVAVSRAVLPHFSRMVIAMDWDGLRHTLLMYSRWLLIVTLPVTLALIYFSESIVAVLFQRGAFTEADTNLVGRVQAMLLLQVPLYMVSMLFVRLISAFKANHWMLWGNVINLCLCIALTYVFMQWFGVVGVALATSIMYIMSCGFLVLVSLRLIKEKTGERR
ncbi:MAG: polysaccharide biosynthesis C-terminal domain-containing protein [Nitrospirae bacterium]|nr:polysaccharide biosynthesis C-terminal domain-containing protein [Nitrospirota bacterium]